jgi:hypothetical protein
MTRSNASSGLGAGQFGFRVGWISGQVGVKSGVIVRPRIPESKSSVSNSVTRPTTDGDGESRGPG